MFIDIDKDLYDRILIMKKRISLGLLQRLFMRQLKKQFLFLLISIITKLMEDGELVLKKMEKRILRCFSMII